MRFTLVGRDHSVWPANRSPPACWRHHRAGEQAGASGAVAGAGGVCFDCCSGGCTMDVWRRKCVSLLNREN